MSQFLATSSSSSLHLPAELNLLAAAPLCEQLRAELGSGIAVALDGSDVQRVSTSCLQVLAAAARKASARGVSFTVQSPSPALLDALADLGLANTLIS